MKLFVTGGTGFVGGHFIEQALAAGHEVTAMRRPGSQPRRPLHAEPRWVDGGLDADWRSALQGQQVLVHLAAHSANPPYDDLPACLRWNVQWPIALAEQARQQGVTRFLVAGSCFEYGDGGRGGRPIRADAALAPGNAYATSKAAASVAFLGWAREHGLQLQLLRIFHVYGEGELPQRFWPALRAAALAGQDFPMSAGEQLRDFVAADDVARQLLAALDFAGAAPGRPRQAHVASGQAQTLLAFAQHWWREWQATGRLLPGSRPYRADELMALVPAPEDLLR